VFVTHAGMGGCSEGLWHGVPMVAVPQTVDQFANADRLVELGVARRLDADATPDELRAAVVTLESAPEVVARLQGNRPRNAVSNVSQASSESESTGTEPSAWMVVLICAR
jgi:UDP-N-acetylglucosamine:LPS N-acetylglucosamine transferase